ncbi:MAG: menaquinone biosynthesis protein [Candidatus Omnitrophica bacterium]|nr:menaquinone biosynthesis protein [Candidatus Omnitrophota bacterium]
MPLKPLSRNNPRGDFSPDEKIRLGEIQFLNTWPVTYALRARIVQAPVELVPGTPADLNRRLLVGQIDASAVSSFLYLQHQEEFVPVPGLCIRSDSDVHSVLVVSRQPLTTLKGRTIGVSNQGATTPVLLKVLAAQRQLKINLEVTNLRYPQILKEFPAALLIGDEALEASQSVSGLQWWDLGEAWNAWTKEPMVYALWVVRKTLLRRDPSVMEYVKQSLMASYEWGRSHEAELIAAMRKIFPFEANFLRRYLHSLSYEFDRKAWEGLNRFTKEAEALGELPEGTARRLRQKEFLPWQEEQVEVL